MLLVKFDVVDILSA